VVFGFFFGTFDNLSGGGSPLTLTNLAGPLGLALIAVLWSYDGWIEITYVAGEVKDPQKNIPRSLILSMLLVIGVYAAVNFMYLFVLSLRTVSTSELVAADAGKVMLGAAGATIAVIGVVISTIGTNNGFVLTGARIYYAMAKERVFFRSLAHVHPTFRTPSRSLVAQGIWASLLVLTGTFEQLFTYVIVVSWIFYAMSATGVFVSRFRDPDMHRPYRTWGYPVTPFLFILFSIYLVLNTLVENPRDSLIGVGIVLIGIPAYWYWTRKTKKERIADSTRPE
jgi:APA family basic amino acid/polyamine antiporter